MDKYTLSISYRPKRKLYYYEGDVRGIEECLASGEIPTSMLKYKDAFGAYDYPGIFVFGSKSNPDIYKHIPGIELRADDDRVDYPEDMSCLELEAAHFMVIEFNELYHMSTKNIDELLDELKDIHPCTKSLFDPDYEQRNSNLGTEIFFNGGRIRFLVPINSDANKVYKNVDSIDDFTKEELYAKAFHEPITGYYNWNHLLGILQDYVKYDIGDFCFVHFDVKDFKLLNEAYSLYTANHVLRKIAKAIDNAEWVYAGARCHNDNFAMLIRDMPDDEIVKTLTDFFESISTLDCDENYKIYYRCGVAKMRTAINYGNIAADSAKMAQAMGNKPNETEIMFYTDEMHDELRWGKMIKQYLETAIQNDEFMIYLQPKFNIDSETIIGAEALARWNFRHREFLYPNRFIPFFEKDGTIGRVDDIVLRKVCETIVRWKKANRPIIPISVNLSRKRLEQDDLVDYLTAIVDSYGIEHEYIDFELTESATSDDQECMMDFLRQLKARGFKISMDDFGTGFSSLSLLTEMPIDTLKIDKSFVDDIGDADDDSRKVILIKHIISMAKDMRFHCLAEGAEEAHQVERLRKMGCDTVQGFYYCRPIPIDEFDKKIDMQTEGTYTDEK